MKKLLTITGPSGSGKSTLERNLLGLDEVFSKVISTTTRKPRVGEVDGVDYYFLSEAEFKKREQGNRFAECITFEGNNRRYGVEVDELERITNSSRIPLVVVEPEGVRQIHSALPRQGWKVRSIFVTHDPEVLITRYVNRENAAFTREDARRILNLIQDELNWERRFDGWDRAYHAYDEKCQDAIHYEILKLMKEC